MKTTLNRLTPCLVAALCLALQGPGAGLRAADGDPWEAEEYAGQAWMADDEDTVLARYEQEQLDKHHEQELVCQVADYPTVFNKARTLIGRRVDDPNGRSLGRIKDIVIDRQTERVSYAVLAVRSGFLGSRQKLLAVPLSAFRPDDYSSRLVLNAERKNLELAQGLVAHQWPSPTAPSWGAAPPWESTSEMTKPDARGSKNTAPARREIQEPKEYPPGSPEHPGF